MEFLSLSKVSEMFKLPNIIEMYTLFKIDTAARFTSSYKLTRFYIHRGDFFLKRMKLNNPKKIFFVVFIF